MAIILWPAANFKYKIVTSIPDGAPLTGSINLSGGSSFNVERDKNILILYQPLDQSYNNANPALATAGSMKILDYSTMLHQNDTGGLRITDQEGNLIAGSWTYETVHADIFDEVKADGWAKLYFNPTSLLPTNAVIKLRVEKYMDYVSLSV